MATTTIDLTSQASRVGIPGANADPQRGFGNFMSTMLGAAMVIGALLVLLYLIWGAIEWITSAGEKGKIESARNKIQNALLGLIVLAATTALFMIVQRFLGICVLRFTGGSC